MGPVLGLPGYLARKAEALWAINEAEALAERFEQRYLSAELHLLRGVFLAIGVQNSVSKNSLGGQHTPDRSVSVPRFGQHAHLARRGE